MPELYRPTLIRPEIYPHSAIFKARRSSSSERGLRLFGVFFVILMTEEEEGDGQEGGEVKREG